MNYMQCQKWKRIAVFDEKKKKTIYFELDDNERLKKSFKSKKVSKFTKEKSLKIKNDISSNHTNSSCVISKKELSQNIIIFSRESNTDKYTLNMNQTNDRKEDTNSIKCNAFEDFKILDFDHVYEMMQNEFSDLSDSYLFR